MLVALLTRPEAAALVAAGIVAIGPALVTLWVPALSLVADVLDSASLDPALGYPQRWLAPDAARGQVNRLGTAAR